MNVKKYLLRHSGDIGVAYLLAILASEGLQGLPEVLLAMKLNVVVIPLAATGVIRFEWWVWYVLAVMWTVQIIHLGGWSLQDVIRGTIGVPQRTWVAFSKEH